MMSRQFTTSSTGGILGRTTERMSRIRQAYAPTMFHTLWATALAGGDIVEFRAVAEPGGEWLNAVLGCTVSFGVAVRSGWSTNVFNYGIFHSAVWDIVVDLAAFPPARPGRLPRCIPKCDQMWMRGMWLVLDKNVAEHEWRFWSWKPELELMPCGKKRPINCTAAPLRIFERDDPRLLNS